MLPVEDIMFNHFDSRSVMCIGKVRRILRCEIWGFHSGEDSSLSLLGSDAM